MPSYGVGVTLQYIAWNTSTNAYVTGDSANHTLRWIKDGTASATTNSPSEVDSTNAPGVYKVVLTTTETSCQVGTLAGKSSTSNVILIGMTCTFENLPTASPAASGGLLTFGSGTGQLNPSSGKIPATLASTDVTGNVAADIQTIKTQTVTCSGGVTVPAATLASTTNITSATGITVSTNNDKTGYSLTATTGLGNQTANITGSLSGSVGSVTGNVGGNVTGSVGSVASGGITSASFGAGAITATVIATDAIDADALAADAVTEIWSKTMTELTSVPAATGGTALQAITFLLEASGHKITQTSTTQTLFKADSTTALATSTVADDGTTFSRAKLS